MTAHVQAYVPTHRERQGEKNRGARDSEATGRTDGNKTGFGTRSKLAIMRAQCALTQAHAKHGIQIMKP